MARTAVPLLLAAVALSSGCATGMAAYSETAKQNFDRGEVELEDESYPEAQRFFTYVRNKFPFSRYAALAELRLADTHYRSAKYAEAIEAYRLFLRFHPSHPDVRYAYYMIGLSYYRQVPDDWWLVLPPAYERDQASVKDTAHAMEEFLNRFPKGRYAPPARELLDDCRQRLAEHELYVARFYVRRERWRAAAWRLEGLRREYGGLGFDAEVLYLLGTAYEAQGDSPAARSAFEALLREHPGSEWQEDATRALAQLPT